MSHIRLDQATETLPGIIEFTYDTNKKSDSDSDIEKFLDSLDEGVNKQLDSIDPEIERKLVGNNLKINDNGKLKTYSEYVQTLPTSYPKLSEEELHNSEVKKHQVNNDKWEESSMKQFYDDIHFLKENFTHLQSAIERCVFFKIKDLTEKINDLTSTIESMESDNQDIGDLVEKTNNKVEKINNKINKLNNQYDPDYAQIIIYREKERKLLYKLHKIRNKRLLSNNTPVDYNRYEYNF
jgi:chromosome segregation ATPase